MTRDDVRKTFPEATDEQVKAIMDLHGADIERTKGAAGADATKLTALQNELDEAKTTIGTLEAAKADADKLQAEIDRYRQAEAKREEARKAAQAHTELESRFNTVAGQRKFVHELVRQSVLSEFEKAVADRANEGKSDTAIFDGLTRDKDYFASMNPPAGGDMGRMGSVPAAETARAVMGLPPCGM